LKVGAKSGDFAQRGGCDHRNIDNTLAIPTIQLIDSFLNGSANPVEKAKKVKKIPVVKNASENGGTY
jgi:hypothetical protein